MSVLWASICAGQFSSSSKDTAGDATEPEPDLACLESCKKEMQACIDECGEHATALQKHHAEPALSPPLPQDDNDNSEEFTDLPLPDFEYWDTDKDGFLSVNEAYRLFHFGLEQRDLLSKRSSVDVVSSFEEFFRSIDENGDGVVSREEFEDEDDDEESMDADKHVAEVAQSKVVPQIKAPRFTKTSRLVGAAAQPPAVNEGFLSRPSKHSQHMKGSNSIREMARLMTALNREVRGL